MKIILAGRGEVYNTRPILLHHVPGTNADSSEEKKDSFQFSTHQEHLLGIEVKKGGIPK